MLFIGDYSDEGGWRGVHLCLETGNVVETDQDGEVRVLRDPTKEELLVAVVEWCNAHQDSPFPSTLYRSIKNSL
jgi:hypothetical protein